ncbi:MAG TPA: flagellar protein FlgN [Janthinobacterium sp.]|nr:flagellar protein FlgN [Janthinobacterium sp.]
MSSTNAPARLTRAQALARLLDGVADDTKAYAALLLLQEEQFEAALRHQGARLCQLGGQIGALVDTLEARRRLRVKLAGALLGPAATMTGIAALLDEGARLRLEADWLALERMVLECKRRNTRNSTLFTDQYSIMRRLLHGEEHIYAPV